MTKIALVVGGDSGLGQSLRTVLAAAGFDVWSTSRQPDRFSQEKVLRLDLADHSTSSEILALAPKVVVFSGAMTSQQACEQIPDIAVQINVRSVVRMAEQFLPKNCKLVFISSNAVFDGTAPHAPADGPLSAMSLYGRHKLDAEQALSALSEDVSIVRLSKLSHSLRPLINGWAESLARGNTITPFSDAVISPIRTEMAATTVLTVIKRDLSGIVQLSASHDVSYYEFARAFAMRFGYSEALIVPTESCVHTDITFPRHTTLNSDRLAPYGILMPAPYDCLVDFSDLATHGP